jgi:hypothetical protein
MEEAFTLLAVNQHVDNSQAGQVITTIETEHPIVVELSERPVHLGQPGPRVCRFSRVTWRRREDEDQ